MEIETIIKLLDFSDPDIKQLYNSWDKGDCSLVGIVEIYLLQCIEKHKVENKEYYDSSVDDIKLRISL